MSADDLLETVWVTKYALTEGILKVRAKITRGAAYWGKYMSSAHGEGKDWHRTEQSALDRAEVMRSKRLASLEAAIPKLRSKKINIKEETTP